MSVKLCPKCSHKLAVAARRGGARGRRRDKVRASALASIERQSRAVKLTARGLTLRVEEWARRTGISKSTIYKRLHRGLSPEQILGL